MSNTSKANCRECQLGLFCYDHLDSPPITPAPTQKEPQSQAQCDSNPVDTAEAKSKELTNDSAPPPDEGVFEKSPIDDGADSMPKSNPMSQHERNPNLPRIQVNGIEIPYWVK